MAKHFFLYAQNHRSYGVLKTSTDICRRKGAIQAILRRNYGIDLSFKGQEMDLNSSPKKLKWLGNARFPILHIVLNKLQ
jgi:hypothetical protein